MDGSVSYSYRQDAAPPSIKGLWCVCFVAALLLYALTCQRGVSWQDGGMFQWRVATGDYRGDLGLALSHPLYILAGRVLATVSGRHLPLVLSAFSGLGMAVALANLAAVSTLLTGKRWIGLAAAAMLSVAHTVWWLSTFAEVYTWSVAGLTAEIWLLASLLRRPRAWTLAALALVSGLGVCVHNFALLPLPVYVVVAVVLIARRKLPAWALAAAVAAYVLGSSMYLAMIVREAVQLGDLGAAVRSALVGKFAPKVLNFGKPRYLKFNAVFAAMNFVSFLGPLAVIGWARLRRRLGGALAGALGAITVLEFFFVARYDVPDQFTFLLPTLVMFAVSAAVGVDVLTSRSRGWRRAAIVACVLSVAAPPVFYAVAPALARRAGADGIRARKLPYRDEVRYWLVPWKHNEDSAERFARQALRQVEPDAVILPDSSSQHPLLLEKWRTTERPDVTVPHGEGPLPRYRDDPVAFRAALGGRPLYVVSPVPGYLDDRLLGDAEFERREGMVLYRAGWKRP